MAKVNGCFYFKRTQQGNLLGEFSNNTIQRTYTESADLISNNDSKDYVGEYISTWQEGNKAIVSLLEISKVGTIYSLVWKLDSSPHFFGKGFLLDDVLIGNYNDK